MKKILNLYYHIINISEIKCINKEIKLLTEKFISDSFHLNIAKGASYGYRENIRGRMIGNKDRISILNRKLRILKNGL